MKSYELVVILPPDSGPDERKAQEKALEDLVGRGKGKVVQKTEIGKRPLGYLLRKFKEGVFLFWELSMEPASIDELRKGLELRDDVLSYMLTIKPSKEMIKRKSLPKAVTKPAAGAEEKRAPAAKT